MSPMSRLKTLARPEGFEPPTPWSEATCSGPLSYGRAFRVILRSTRACDSAGPLQHWTAHVHQLESTRGARGLERNDIGRACFRLDEPIYADSDGVSLDRFGHRHRRNDERDAGAVLVLDP